MSVDACATTVDRQPSPHASQPTPPVQQPVVASSTPVTPQSESVTASSSAPQSQPAQMSQLTTTACSTPQPSSSSQPSQSPIVICSSARMPALISSSAVSTVSHSPVTQTSIAVPSSLHTPIISTTPQTTISQVQVPVSAQVSHNNVSQTTHLPNLTPQMNVAVSQIPQVQVIQQSPGTYHLQHLYHNPGQQMFLQPGNLTIQPAFQSTSGGLQLQLPTNATGQVPISSVTNKTPIVSKSTQLQLSSISSNIGTTQQVITSMKTGINPAGTQMIKPMLPSQFAAANSHQIVISPYGMLPQHQQTILPANKAVLDAQKGKSFMLHNPIQPKSPILPTTAMTSQFKTQLNANQLITQASPAMIANQTQILGSFSAIPQAFLAPQSLMGQNSSPIFIRGPGQQDIGFIQTSSPQLQTVSGNPIYMNPNGGTMQVVQTNHTSCPVTSMAHSFISTSTPTTTSHVNSNVTTTSHSVSMGNVVQHPTIAPAPSNQTAIRPKPLRPSVGTQTAASPSQQKLAAETNLAMLKPIAAKTKTPVAPKSNVTTATTKPAASVVSTQTLTSQQQAQESMVQKANTDISVSKVNTVKTKPTPTQKSSAAQTTISRSAPISASSQTLPQQPSVQSAQVPPNTPQPVSTPSQTVASPQLHQSSSTTTQHPEEALHSQLTQTKPPQKEKHIPPASVSHVLPPKPKVEKRDAATEQDVELMGLSNELKTPPQSKKAIVKPQVMTHVIDGYIIQESPNPFPVNGKYNDVICETTNKQEESIASLNQMIVTNGVESKAKMPVDVSKCENCGKTVPKSKNHTRKRKRFCSQNCVKAQNKQPKLGLFNPVKSSLTEFDITNIDNPLSTSEAELQSEAFEVHDDRKRMKMSKKSHGLLSTVDVSATKSDACSSKTDSPETNGENISSVSTEITSNGSEDMSNRTSIAGVYIPTGGQNPIKWSVQDVYDFVRNLPGCQEYADEFRSQEIDGQALMLLKEDHLMSAMSMKLGPALKICSKINALREKADAAKLM